MYRADPIAQGGLVGCYCPDCYFQVTQFTPTNIAVRTDIGRLCLSHRYCCRCEDDNDLTASALCSDCSSSRRGSIVVSSEP